MDGKAQWLTYSQQIQQRSLETVSLQLSSAWELRTQIFRILNRANSDRILANKMSEIQSLLKMTDKSSNLIEITGGQRNFKRKREIPHFSRNDGCWFDFAIFVSEETKVAEVIGFDFELRFPEQISTTFIRFDLNPPDHNNQEDGLRFHVHPGHDDFQIHSPAMNPLEILHLFLYGFQIPEKLRRSSQ